MDHGRAAMVRDCIGELDRHMQRIVEALDVGDYWGEHPEYPLADWQYEVENDDTRLSYWQWVAMAVTDH